MTQTGITLNNDVCPNYILCQIKLFLAGDGATFLGNMNGEELIEYYFSTTWVARYIRLFPTESRGVIASMRWELYGC